MKSIILRKKVVYVVCIRKLLIEYRGKILNG